MPADVQGMRDALPVSLPSTGREAVIPEHPFGPAVAAQLAVKSRIRAEVELTRLKLAECTGDPGCPAQLHHPGCWVER